MMKLSRAFVLLSVTNTGPAVVAFVVRPTPTLTPVTKTTSSSTLTSSSRVAGAVPATRVSTFVAATVEDTTLTKDDGVPNFAAETRPLDEADLFGDGVSGFDSDDDAIQPWQESLEVLLAPDTPSAKRQIVLSDLLNAGENIQEDLRTALRDGKIDGLLTPTGKRLQEGTRAVARQLATDILPGIAAVAAGERQIGKAESPAVVIARDLPSVVPKIGSRVLAAVSNQARANLELLQGDLADPTRIPKRIQKQAEEAVTEAGNVFRETPEGLEGPAYDVVEQGEGYEIRDYDGYSVASTNMLNGVDEPYSMDDLASGGEAFNALAAYLFGANEDKKVMEMTTPVSTTSTGEMRFYLRSDNDGSDFPQPVSENDEVFNEKGSVKVKTIPPARLVVAKFTGFVTEGEVARQKDALLAKLSLDGVEIDVPHASVVPHVIFQYNPPYTIPILRRNEIAVPVRRISGGGSVVDGAGNGEGEASSGGVAVSDLVKEWDIDDEDGDA